MWAARKEEHEGERTSVWEVRLVDVPVGRVRFLSLSSDFLTLAAAVGGSVNFFSVPSLLLDQV